MAKTSKPKNVALTGGGTGGHIYPCLAVAEALKASKPKSKLYYIGHAEKLEAELLHNPDLQDADNKPYSSYIDFLGIIAYPLPRTWNPFKILQWLIRFWFAIQAAAKHLKENKIDVVFGTGGYVAAPVFGACIMNKIPYILHNLDAHMGLANTTFVKDAKAVTLGFPGLEDIKPKSGQVKVTGNPVSQSFIQGLESSSDDEQLGNLDAVAKKALGKRINLLITGGSQGAQSINNAIGGVLQELSENGLINILHIAGPKLYKDYLAEFLDGDPNKYSNYKVIAYTHQMPKLSAQADIAICRSGAMTIAEMAASGIVPIFIPLPWAAQNHQQLNAQSLVDGGAAIIIKQPDKDAPEDKYQEFRDRLLHTIEKLCEDAELVEYMRENLKAFAKPDAAKEIAKLVFSALKS